MPLVRSFAPVASASARVLILGSMPGVRSLEAGQYYAHPQNAFWPIVGSICGFDHEASYVARTRSVKRCGIALWDVLRCCDREGSLDASIVGTTAEANDFAGFLARYRKIATVLCNGATSHTKFERLVLPELDPDRPIRCVRLPSTSPANASVSAKAKMSAWRRALLPLLTPS